MAEGQSRDEVERLLAGALHVWRLEARLEGDDSGCFHVSLGGVRATVERLATGGWSVEAGGRRTRHAGIPGMLRTLHAALDPDYRPTRFRIAPAPGE